MIFRVEVLPLPPIRAERSLRWFSWGMVFLAWARFPIKKAGGVGLCSLAHSLNWVLQTRLQDSPRVVEAHQLIN